MKKIIKIAQCLFFGCVFILSGCGKAEAKKELKKEDYMSISKSPNELSNFSFETILVYSSPNLEKPVMELKQIFEDSTGCEVQVNIAEENEIVDNIKTYKMGDIAIVDSTSQKEYTGFNSKKSKGIALHKPVLAVKKGEFSGINTLDGLVEKRVSFLVAPSNTAIGKISKRFFEENSDKYIFDYTEGIDEKNLLSVLNDYDNYAAIVWRENCTDKNVDIIEIPELDNLFSWINISKLAVSKDDIIAEEFIEFINSDSAKEIWKKYGFDVI